MNDVDRAERMQAVKAFAIPASLFVACLFNAAGIYILYSGNSVGVFFIGIGFAIIVSGMFLFITFQNKQRTAGKWKQVAEDMTPPQDGQWQSLVNTSGDPTPVDPMPAYTPRTPADIANR